MKKIIITLYLFFSFIAHSNDCRNSLAHLYDDSGTCDVVKMQLSNNALINETRKARLEKLRKELGNLIISKSNRTLDSMGKLDRFFDLTNSSQGLGAIPNCSIDNMTSLSCSDNEYFKEIFSEIGNGGLNNISDLGNSWRNSFSGNSFASVGSGISCNNPALLLEKKWAGNDDILDSNSETASLLSEMKKVASDRAAINEIPEKYKFLEDFYPSLWKDISDGLIIIPDNSNKTVKSFLSELLSTNKRNIEISLGQQCNETKTMLEEGICKKINGSELVNPTLSNSFFGYDPRGHETGFDSMTAEDNFEVVDTSFRHYAASCFGAGCSDETCLSFDTFLTTYFDGEVAHLNVDNSRLSMLSRDDLTIKNECIQLNCVNHAVVIENNDITCEERSTHNISALREEFSCGSNSNSNLCETLTIVEQSRQRPLSSFARSVLGQEVSQTIISSTTDSDSLAINTGINEESIVSLETPYDRGERSYEATNNNTTEPATTAAATAVPTRRSSAAKAPTQTRNSNTEVRTTRTAGPILDNSPISTSSVTDTGEEEYTEEETSLIGSLRDAISSTITDIGDAAKRAVTPRESTPAVSENTAARLGETTAVAGSTGVSADDSFSSDFRESSLAVQPGNAPEGFDGMQEETVASGDESLTTGARSLATGGDTGRALASVGDGAQNTGYVDVNSELLQSISLTAGELEVLDEARIRELNIPMTEPFVLMINVSGRDVPVKVRQIAQGDSFVLRPLIDESNQEVEDELRKAPIFASYFNSPVMRTKGLEILLDGE